MGKVILGPQAVSFVERSIMQCPYLDGPLLEVLLYVHSLIIMVGDDHRLP